MSIFVRGSWPRVHRPVCYEIISTDVLERFPVVVYFRSLTRAPRYLQVEESEAERIQTLTAFTAWCCSSERNQVGTISGKLTAVQFFHRRDAGLELPINSSLIKRALRGMANSHVVAGTPRRVHLPTSWDVLLAGRGYSVVGSRGCLLYTSPSPRD